MTRDLRLIPFSEDHYGDYKQWFQSPSIQSALGDIDAEWLEYVINDAEGREYAVLDGNDLVAVVGLVYPTNEHPFFVISNIAVHPEKHNRGIGSWIIHNIAQTIKEGGDKSWVAYVEHENVQAQKFFVKNGWQQSGHADDSHMIRFEK